nr:aliphatic sulfonate ABC transporter substrate-binding protein [Motilibacter deserti]
MRIGVHSSNPTIDVFSRRPELQQQLAEAGVDFRFLPHPGGVETVALLRAGAIDIAGTGSTPPLTAQAAGADVVYLATSGPRPERGGVAVRTDSGITDVAQLRGRTVALAHGSWQTSSLAFTLERAGLGWDDVTPLDLSTPAAEQAFVAGDLDAWVLPEPTLSAVEQKTGVRVLVPTTDVLTHRSVFFGLRSAAEEQPEQVAAVLAALDATDRWIEANPDEAAAVLAARPGVPGGTSVWRAGVDRRPWGLLEPSPEFLDEQQRAADVLTRSGVLPRSIDVRAALPARSLVPAVSA